MTHTRFTLDNSTPSLWRVTFNNPPINLIDSVMIGELRELFAEVERHHGPTVLVFDSADTDYFLAHYDITAANRSLVDSLPMRSFRRRWTRSGKQWRAQRCRREPAKRSKTAYNNAPPSNFAWASTWHSSSRGSRRLVARTYNVM